MDKYETVLNLFYYLILKHLLKYKLYIINQLFSSHEKSQLHSRIEREIHGPGPQGILGPGDPGRGSGARQAADPGSRAADPGQGHTIVIICLLFYFVILLLLFTYCYNLPIVRFCHSIDLLL